MFMGKKEVNTGGNNLGTFAGALPARNLFSEAIKNDQIPKARVEKRTASKAIDQIRRGHQVLFPPRGRGDETVAFFIILSVLRWLRSSSDGHEFPGCGGWSSLWSQCLVDFSFLGM